MPAPDPIAGYDADAADLVPRFEKLSTEAVLAPILDLIPPPPARILEIGAGTGRDAAWLAARGHPVLAVEPAAAFRAAGASLHPELRWADDRLPLLAAIRTSGERFDLLLLVAVWQHLPPADHTEAVRALAALAAPDGRIILSLRHGPGAPDRPCHPASPDTLIDLARAAGLALIFRRETPSIQPRNRAAGVTWTWLAFERPALPKGRSS